MNARSILNYIAWHLGIRPEQTRQPEPRRSSARITYMGSEHQEAPRSVSSGTGAATGETDGGQGEP